MRERTEQGFIQFDNTSSIEATRNNDRRRSSILATLKLKRKLRLMASNEVRYEEETSYDLLLKLKSVVKNSSSLSRKVFTTENEVSNESCENTFSCSRFIDSPFPYNSVNSNPDGLILQGLGLGLGHDESTCTHDYVKMSRQYNRLSKYKLLKMNSMLCLSCNISKVNTVFFPCEHCIVCSACQSIGVCGRSSNFRICPVCNEQIKFTAVRDGSENKAWWCWVNEAKPFVDPIFLRVFRRDSINKILEQSTKYIQGERENKSLKWGLSCVIS
mmetsp:Transcript_3059/g.4210  ORF Transcript_3059/g.4210 Transcript_3059/m.4210 type:complete len:272 (-) Transcript_3059:1409-2224(-)